MLQFSFWQFWSVFGRNCQVTQALLPLMRPGRQLLLLGNLDGQGSTAPSFLSFVAVTRGGEYDDMMDG
jgi:hypothetical protein